MKNIFILAMTIVMSQYLNADVLPKHWKGSFKLIEVKESDLGEYKFKADFEGKPFYWFEKTHYDKAKKVRTTCSYPVLAIAPYYLGYVTCETDYE